MTIDHAYQEMRSALKLDHTKLFSTTQYLTKNQIRSFFGRLAKKRSTQRRNQETEKTTMTITIYLPVVMKTLHKIIIEWNNINNWRR